MALSRSRRACLQFLFVAGFACGQKPADPSASRDWVCPMDPDYRSNKPGICPRCGMTLVIDVPDRVEYPLEISYSPELLQPGCDAVLTLRALDPVTGASAKRFQVIHEKLVHL
ncbi:MAG: hypothetical protein JO210_16520, partial [Acidobacteriaceae bacterium]|nr:hypothetical protein [Acidobacteriaceae bacterium]